MSAGAAARALNDKVPLERLQEVNDAYATSLGAARATTSGSTFGRARAGRRCRSPIPSSAAAAPAADAPQPPWVMATYTAGGLGELTELIHETGHAIHVAAIDTRPAFATGRTATRSLKRWPN